MTEAFLIFSLPVYALLPVPVRHPMGILRRVGDLSAKQSYPLNIGPSYSWSPLLVLVPGAAAEARLGFLLTACAPLVFACLANPIP